MTRRLEGHQRIGGRHLMNWNITWEEKRCLGTVLSFTAAIVAGLDTTKVDAKTKK
jgi:hypothetical protein